jgi:hypothetical protein
MRSAAKGGGRCGRWGGEERLGGGLGFDGFYMLSLWAFVGWIRSGLAKTIYLVTFVGY